MSLLVVGFVASQAQEQTDSYLQDIANVVKELRNNSNSARNSAIAKLSVDDKPKMTLMDELKWAGSNEEKANEVKGAKGNRFKLNQVVTYVYKKQNLQMESKGDMLNGNEKDIHYSAIEKGVKRGGKVTYEIYGRTGNQDFVFVPFNPRTKYVVTMQAGRETVTKEATDVCHIHIKVSYRNVPITLSVSYPEDKANSAPVESFAILNYNPQK